MQLKKAVLGELKVRLIEDGWVFLDEEDDLCSFEVRMSDQIHFELDLGVSDRWGVVSLSPSLGVYVPEISRLRTEFIGLPQTRVCIVGFSLIDRVRVELGPSVGLGRWAFRRLEDVGAIVGLLVGDIRSYGLPSLGHVQSLEGVVRHMEGVARSQFDSANLALANAVIGRVSDGLVALKEYIDKGVVVGDAISEDPWLFVYSYLKYFLVE